MPSAPSAFSHNILKYIRFQRKVWTQTKRKIFKKKQLVIIASAHKVGSTWLSRLVEGCCYLENYALPQQIIDKHPNKQQVDIDLSDILEELVVPVGGYIYKTHSYPPTESFAAKLPDWVKFITVIRDPRDVLISSSFYLANLPEDQGGWGEDFRNLEIGERIIRIIENGDFLKSRLREWFQCPYAYKTRYENLLSDAVGELQRLLSHMNMEEPQAIVSYVKNKHSFKSQTGRSRGSEQKSAFLRKGVSGDWKNYFDDKVKNAFKQSLDGDWNNLLIELGYEENPNW